MLSLIRHTPQEAIARRDRRRRRIHQQAVRLIGKERLRLLQEDRARADLGLAPFGYDPFGFELETVLQAIRWLAPLYRHWFRVESVGIDHIPDHGRALIVSNHSGVLPLDGMMIGLDCVLHKPHPRLMRSIIEVFFANVPFVSLFMQRVGQVVGTRTNFRWLLEHEELVAVFPEGAKGTGKLFRDRYKMRKFNVGFMELAIRHRAPIIPTCVIGGEEQYIMLADLKPLARRIGFPYFPVTLLWPHFGLLGFVPLPVRYRIHYGEPYTAHLEHGPEALRNPRVIAQRVAEVRRRIEELIRDGLRRRHSLFRG